MSRKFKQTRNPKEWCEPKGKREYNLYMTEANNYDSFAPLRQKQLQNGEVLPHKYVEKPMMAGMLPNLSGKKVLMIGCGTGEETELLEKYGAEGLVGIDLSKVSVELAQKAYPRHTFSLGDMHSLDFADSKFDFVYSSLTIHYSPEPETVYREIHRTLKPAGQFLFSVGHPVRWASERILLDGSPTKVLGYSEDKDRPRLYGGYHTFAEYEENLTSDGLSLRFWVGPPSFHFQLLKKAGFQIDDFQESKAIEECKVVNPSYYERHREFPQFFAFLSTRK